MSANERAILLMILAMAGFAGGDLGIKILANLGLPTGQITLVLGIGGTLGFAALTKAQGQPLWSSDLFAAPVLLRYLFEFLAALCMISALALTPLSTVTAILQAAPLMVTMGAALIFGEQVGWRRWSAILIGLLGVMIILRPGSTGFDAYALLAVGAMLALAARDLATRAAPQTLSNLQLATFGFSALILAGLILLPFTPAPIPLTFASTAWLAFTIAATIGGYYAVTGAMRIGEISVVSPFRYSRLVFGAVLGVMVFGEQLDLWMMVGAALVVGSGLYAVLRERRAMLHVQK